MVGILESAQLIEVLARGNVAQGECGSHEIRGAGQGFDERGYALHEHIAQAVLQELGGERRRADVSKLLESSVARLGVCQGHGEGLKKHQ
jgi:hypothetical protein